MWTEKMNLGDIGEIDTTIRDIMNQNHAKYKLQINASLYLKRFMGDRGLKNLEVTYKKLKIKAALKIITDKEPRMKMVKTFEENRMKKKRTSIIKDAIEYTKNDFHCELKFSKICSSLYTKRTM